MSMLIEISLGLQRGPQGDCGIEHSGDWTILLRIRCDFIEFRLINSGDLCVKLKVYGRNGPIALNLLQREGRLRSQALGREPRTT